MSDQPQRKPLVDLTVSLGTILVIITMLGTAAAGLYTVGGQVRGVRDAIDHEVEMRGVSERAIVSSQTAAALQEARDVQGIGQSLQDLKADMRSLVQASTPQPERRK